MKFAIAFAVVYLVFCHDAESVSGIEHQLKPEVCEYFPLDIAFVVDASSAGEFPENFTTGLQFVKNFVNKFNIGPEQVRVSMVIYSDRVHEEDAFNFGDHTEKAELNEAIEAELNKSIDSMPNPSGQSRQTGAAINFVVDNQLPHARDYVRKVIIVLTDGNSQGLDVAKAALQNALERYGGLEVLGIGVGHDVSEDELHSIVDNGRHVFIVDAYSMLWTIRDRLAFETCGILPKPECKYDPTDLAFVIDTSRSIEEENFNTMRQFIWDFVNSFEINPSAVQVAAVMFGVVAYGDSAIPFDSERDKNDTLDAIMDLEWMDAPWTDTGAGIDYMVKNFLPHTRPHAVHIGIVITDGQSHRKEFTKETAKKARDEGVIMYVVGVGKIGPTSLAPYELNDIAGDSSRVLNAEDFTQLNLIKEELMLRMCAGIYASLQKTPGMPAAEAE